MSSQRPQRRAPRAPAVAGRTIAIVLVAVIVGIVILWKGFGGKSTPKVATTKASTAVTSSTAVSVAPTTTVPPITVPLASIKVLVANGKGESGIAGRTSTALKTKGLTVNTPVDATAKAPKTAIYFVAGAEKQAAAVAQFITGAPAPVAMPAPPPVATLGDAVVLVVLGADFAPGQVGVATVAASSIPTVPAVSST